MTKKHIAPPALKCNAPTIHPSEDSFAHLAFNENQLKHAVDTFKSEGCVVSKKSFDQELLQGLREEVIKFAAKDVNVSAESELSKPYLEKNPKSDFRITYNFPIQGIFNNPAILQNSFIFPLVNNLLGGEAVLDKFYVFMTVPGSDRTAVHIDHPNLFSDESACVNRQNIPPVSISVFIPLNEINSQNGATRCWPQSHKFPMKQVKQMEQDEGKTSHAFDAYMQTGDCLLMDSRTVHQGMENLSDECRIILLLNYCRPWFRDTTNTYRVHLKPMEQKDYMSQSEQLQFILQKYAADYYIN